MQTPTTYLRERPRKSVPTPPLAPASPPQPAPRANPQNPPAPRRPATARPKRVSRRRPPGADLTPLAVGNPHSSLLSDEELSGLSEKWGQDALPLLDEAAQIFNSLDSGKRHELRQTDFLRGMGQLGGTAPLGHFLFSAVDKSSSRSLRFVEFFDFYMTVTRGSPQDRAALGYRLLDLDGDGGLGREEVAAVAQSMFYVLGQLGLDAPDIDEFVDAFFARLDPEGSGAITPEAYAELSAQHETFMRTFAPVENQGAKLTTRPGRPLFFGHPRFGFMLNIMAGIQTVVERSAKATAAELLWDTDEEDDEVVDVDEEGEDGGTPRAAGPPTPTAVPPAAPPAAGGAGADAAAEADEEESKSPLRRRRTGQPAPLERSGFLLKKGNGHGLLGRRNWKRRWFVMAGGRLKYYKQRHFTTPKGEVLTQGVQIRLMEHSRHPWHFQVWHADRGVLDLRAGSEQEMKDWIRSLQRASAESAPVPDDGEGVPRARAVSQLTYALSSSTSDERVTMTTYAPHLFRDIRHTYGMSDERYLQSLGVKQFLGSLMLGEYSSLREMGSEGKSGSFFYFAHDAKVMVKTIASDEVQSLKDMVRGYRDHVVRYPDTLLTRLLGLYRLNVGTHSYNFVVMYNVFDTSLKIHQRYDLKGSTQGRTVGEARRNEPGLVLKDLDLKALGRRINVGPLLAAPLRHQLIADSHFLRTCGVLDYSLLLGVHRRTEAEFAAYQPDSGARRESTSARPADTPVSQERVAVDESRTSGGLFQQDSGGMDTVRIASFADGQMPVVGEEVLFVGIIDYLIPYKARKQGEYRIKHLATKSDTFSVVPPGPYSQRFRRFMVSIVDGARENDGEDALQSLVEDEEHGGHSAGAVARLGADD